MKKFASIALSAVLLLSLCACGRKNKQTEPTTTTTVPPTITTTAPTTAPTTSTTMPTILPDPTLDSLIPDSGLLDTSESTQDTTGTARHSMK